MDSGDGTFKRINLEKFEELIKKPEPKVFKEGEILEIRGSRFRVEAIQRKKMILKLLPALQVGFLQEEFEKFHNSIPSE